MQSKKWRDSKERGIYATSRSERLAVIAHQKAIHVEAA